MTGVVVAQVSDANDPQHQGRVKLTFPWLSDDYVSDWARTVQPGAGKDRGSYGAARGRRRGAGGVRAGRHPPAVRGRRPVQRHGHPADGRPDRRRRLRLRGDQPTLVGLPARAPDRPARPGRPDRGHHADHRRRDKLQLDMDSDRHHGHPAQRRHGDSSRRKRASTIDAGGAKLELKGGEISLTATSGVTVDGGSGAVKVHGGQRAEPVRRLRRSSTAAGRPRSPAAATTTIRGGLVRIN